MSLDLLNKMLGRGGSSKDIAMERLRLVLVHDRASVSPQFLDMLKEELIKVISDYMDIDVERMEVTLRSSEHSVALLASIPIRRLKRTFARAR